MPILRARSACRRADHAVLRSADRLSEKIIDAEIEKDEAVRELGQLTNYEPAYE